MGKYMKRIKKYLIMLSLIAVTIFLRHSCTVQAAQEDDIFKELYMEYRRACLKNILSCSF